MRNDLDEPYENVAAISIDNKPKGSCNPPEYGDKDDCTFFDCTDSLNPTTVRPTSPIIDVSITFSAAVRGHLCSCNTESGTCGKTGQVKTKSKSANPKTMSATGRITLTPVGNNNLITL